MTLSPEDLVRWTGRTRPTAQARWLRGEGVSFRVNARNKVQVAQAEFDRIMVRMPKPAARKTGNLEALRNYGKKKATTPGPAAAHV